MRADGSHRTSELFDESLKEVFNQWVIGGDKTNDYRWHQVLYALNKRKLDRTLAWRLSYYLHLINDCGKTPDIEIFNLLWRGLRLSDPVQYSFIDYLLNEMDRFQVEANDVTVYEIINFCAEHPTVADGAFQQTADQYMGIYEDYIKQFAENGTRYDTDILFSYLKVWINAGNKRHAYRVLRWIENIGGLTKAMQRAYREIGIQASTTLASRVS